MFEWLFGGGKTASKVVDTVSDSVKGIGNWIDEQQFTTEEAVKAKAELVKEHIGFLKNAYDENGIRSITRRILAWFIVIDVILLADIATYFAINKDIETVRAIVDVANAFWLGEGFLAIIAFYFGITFLRTKGK